LKGAGAVRAELRALRAKKKRRMADNENKGAPSFVLVREKTLKGEISQQAQYTACHAAPKAHQTTKEPFLKKRRNKLQPEKKEMD